MKKTLMVLLAGVCVLGVTQIGKGGASSSSASQLAAYADYFGTAKPMLDLEPAGLNGNAALPGTRDYNTAFPEPATMMLFGLGLLGLASFKRRFK